MPKRTALHGAVAVFIAVAVLAVVWSVNGRLPYEAVILWAVFGVVYFYWRPDFSL